MKGRVDNKGWIHCPLCGGKTRTKILENTTLKQFPLFCPKCKNECTIDIEDRQLKILEPAAMTQSQ